jgi:hypothetical protein
VLFQGRLFLPHNRFCCCSTLFVLTFGDEGLLRCCCCCCWTSHLLYIFVFPYFCCCYVGRYVDSIGRCGHRTTFVGGGSASTARKGRAKKTRKLRPPSKTLCWFCFDLICERHAQMRVTPFLLIYTLFLITLLFLFLCTPLFVCSLFSV